MLVFILLLAVTQASMYCNPAIYNVSLDIIKGAQYVIEVPYGDCVELNGVFYKFKKDGDLGLKYYTYTDIDCKQGKSAQIFGLMADYGCNENEPETGIVARLEETDSDCGKKTNYRFLIKDTCIPISGQYARFDIDSKSDSLVFSTYSNNKCQGESTNITVASCGKCYTASDHQDLLGDDGKIKCGSAATFIAAFIVLMAFIF